MAHKHTRPRPHAALRHRSQIPLPAVEDVDQRLAALRSPSLLAPRQMERRDPRQPQRLIRMRQRLLTLPVLGAILVSLVWRRVPSVAEVQKVWAREGVVGRAPLRVSSQAIANRRDVLPAAVLGQLVGEVGARLPAQPLPALPHPRWAAVRAHCSLLAMVDGSPLEALRQQTAVLRERTGLVLAGKMMVLGDAFSHRPLGPLDTEAPAANDKRFAGESLAALPSGGLVVCDLGVFRFVWCADWTDQQPFFVTRRRDKTAYRTIRELSSSPSYRDDIVRLGQYRSNPCQPPRRMVSGLWQGTWSRYRPKGLDPQVWSARQGCALYRRRWRLEDAFALTKRLWALASVWTGSSHAVQWQI